MPLSRETFPCTSPTPRDQLSLPYYSYSLHSRIVDAPLRMTISSVLGPTVDP